MQATDEQLDQLRKWHLFGAAFTWAMGIALSQLARQLYLALMAGKVPAKDEQAVFAIMITIAVYAGLHALHGVGMLVIARWIHRRERFGMIYIGGAINAIIFPSGTLLCLATSMILSRPGVKEMFQRSATPGSST